MRHVCDVCAGGGAGQVILYENDTHHVVLQAGVFSFLCIPDGKSTYCKAKSDP